MTTIAWDGKRILAADRGVDIGGYRAVEDKVLRMTIDRETVLLPGIRKGDDAFVAGAGLSSSLALFMEWLSDASVEAMPELKKGEELIIVTRSRALRVDSGGYGTPVRGPQGLGSGGDVACGCMLMGASAAEAVRAVSKHLSPQLSFGGYTTHDRRDLRA